MKYMGSKKSMLANGLGETIATELQASRRFVDLFTGSGSVSWYVATKWPLPVYACDLQDYAVALAGAVIARDNKRGGVSALTKWHRNTSEYVHSHPLYDAARSVQERIEEVPIEVIAQKCRQICMHESAGPITAAYGGYYFSPLQALWIDGLRKSVPDDKYWRSITLAAVIRTASKCAASPGHTAQPFKPNASAGPFLRKSWLKDIESISAGFFASTLQVCAQSPGKAIKSDAEEFAANFSREGDLVFVDPPYSAVHYSRFYHVLETVARGLHTTVVGDGRYPPLEERPSSAFSIKTQASGALSSLLSTVSSKGARAILTFPEVKSSNGLSGDQVIEICSQFFSIDYVKVSGQFSTLGGNARTRSARKDSSELIITMSPR